jgi:hypothetical protein
MAVRRHASGYNASFVRVGNGVYVQWTECGAKSATAAALQLLQHVLWSCTVPLLLLVLSQHVLFQAASLLLPGFYVCHVSYILLLLLLLLWTVVVLLLLVLMLRLR